MLCVGKADQGSARGRERGGNERETGSGPHGGGVALTLRSSALVDAAYAFISSISDSGMASSALKATSSQFLRVMPRCSEKGDSVTKLAAQRTKRGREPTLPDAACRTSWATEATAGRRKVTTL